MKKIILILAGVCLLWLQGCKEDEIDLYSGDHYIRFIKDLTTDSTTVAFLFAPGASELNAPLVVEAAGIAYPVEKEYKISIDRQFTTAVEGRHFRLPDNTTFKAGAMRDTLAIKFLRTEDMATQSFRLVLRVEANESFKLGQLEYQYMVFLVHDKISQPEWWTTAISTSYMGTYSDRKYQYFIEVTGIVDLTGATPSEIRAHALKFKYWLEEQRQKNNTILEENGNEMTVPVAG
ncbi:MAG: DUF4843 domain-containing protein [Prevotellaceae bacterium]|jgi:hypothetical protein|nr:DUF4843 domain-containing protein [Prevotellaceae bacterium]